MPDPSTTDEYLDERQLAERTPISRATWRRMRAAGGGPPARRVGRRVVYHWPSVRAWIDAQPSSAKGA